MIEMSRMLWHVNKGGLAANHFDRQYKYNFVIHTFYYSKNFFYNVKVVTSTTSTFLWCHILPKRCKCRWYFTLCERDKWRTPEGSCCWRTISNFVVALQCSNRTDWWLDADLAENCWNDGASRTARATRCLQSQVLVLWSPWTNSRDYRMRN